MCRCVLTLLILFLSFPCLACTLVFTDAGESPLVGSNLDCSNVFGRVWFVPASEGEYGRFCFGTDQEQRIAEGGMNERGLFIGVNALDEDTGWKADPGLPDWETWEGWMGTGVPDGILARCATVEEALTIFAGYNLLTLGRVKFLLADRSGDSRVVEFSDGQLGFVSRGDHPWQVSTNFVQSDFAPHEIPCYRYRLATCLLEEGAGQVVDGVRGVLSATHLEFQTPTVVSTICDLKSGTVWLYYFHDFEHPLSFELEEELAAGHHGFLLSERFPVRSYVASVYEEYRRQGGG